MDNLNANVNLETKRGFGYDAINAGISYTNRVLGSDDEGDTIKAFEYGAHWCREQMLACLNAPLDGIQCKECGEAFLLKVLGCRLETLRKMLEVG